MQRAFVPNLQWPCVVAVQTRLWGSGLAVVVRRHRAIVEGVSPLWTPQRSSLFLPSLLVPVFKRSEIRIECLSSVPGWKSEM